MNSFLSLAKECYVRTQHRLSNEIVTYELAGNEVQFHAVTYEEFRRFRTLMGEELILQDLLEHLEPTDVFFDVGANVGTYSCFVAGVVDRGHVVAFEPETDNAGRLQENASLNELEINIQQIALSDAGGSTHLELDDTIIGAGAHSLVNGGSPKTVEVPQEAGDHLVDRGVVPEPTVIKIDVEGAEMKVLKGLQETLSRDSCRLVYCEVHPDKLRKFGQTVPPLYDFLRARGYSIHVIKKTSHKFFVKAEKGTAHPQARSRNHG